ncbi:hypothetical protein [Actinoplanes sp. NPDC051859]|uniref:LppU/SCO3897 family protein n=1 Tax=Actinoplanes sp. NPDC051859 TaxID=3363909 RepID=UPI0037B68FD5
MWNPIARHVAAGVVALVTCAIVGSLLVTGDGAEEAVVGDCLATAADARPGETEDQPEATVVGCAEPAAAFTVVGRVEAESDAQSRACERFFAADEEYFLYTSTAGQGYLLCLRRAG